MRYSNLALVEEFQQLGFSQGFLVIHGLGFLLKGLVLVLDD
jgi:hypothetical protein